ncbi:MAG TPA: SUF system Fe-S cluster assembly protein [Rhodocyclaceae bacterium]|nr:SUF system Fe-S cluster assembly protein [Rhodocyclaceae bacterium]
MSIIDWLKKHDEGGRGDREPATPGGTDDTLREAVIEALRTVYDPEIPVNIYDLGLIYALSIDASDGSVDISMTLTAPGCPVAASFPATVERAVRAVPGVSKARVELVWDPPWSRERMSEAARLQLGML